MHETSVHQYLYLVRSPIWFGRKYLVDARSLVSCGILEKLEKYSSHCEGREALHQGINHLESRVDECYGGEDSVIGSPS